MTPTVAPEADTATARPRRGTRQAKPEPTPTAAVCKFAYMRAIVESDLTNAEVRLAVAVWNHTDETGGNAYPGPARLAEETGTDERSVRRRLKTLTERGWLVQTLKGGVINGRRIASVYALSVPSPVDSQRGKSADSPDGGATSTPHGGATTTPHPGATSTPPSDPASDPASNPLGYTRTSPKMRDGADDNEKTPNTSAAADRAAAADPISPEFHRSADRRLLVAAVREVAETHVWGQARSAAEQRLEAVSELLFGVSVFGFTAAELSASDAEWIGSINAKHRNSREAAIWLNKRLHQWQRDAGQLRWRGDAAAADDWAAADGVAAARTAPADDPETRTRGVSMCRDAIRGPRTEGDSL